MDAIKRSADPAGSGRNADPRTSINGCFDTAWYEAILQNMSDGLLIADALGRIVDMNPAALAMFGFGSREDMVRVMSGGATVMDFTSTDGKELSIGQWPLTRAGAGETFTGQEYSVYVRPTKRRWFASFSGAPVLDKAGKIEYVVLTIRDTSERKHAEWKAQAARELAENKMTEALEYRNRLDAVMQTLPVGVAILDTQGGTVLANAAFDDIWGRPRPEIRTIDDHAKFKASWVDSGKTVLPEEWASSRALRKGETVRGQIFCIEGFDGVARFVHNSAAPILDAHGEVAGCAVAVQDISQHMVLEESFRGSEQKYRDLVRLAPAGIYEVDFRTKKFTSVNDAMCIATGYSRDEMLAMGPFEILNDQGRAAFQTRLGTWMRGEKPDENVEYKVRTKDGREIIAVLNVNFTVDESGKPKGATVVAHDITERKKIEEKLQTTLQRFYLILSNMHFGILLVTNESRVEFVNQSFCDMFGLKDPPDDLMKLSADEMIDKIRPCYTKPDEAIARIRELVLLGQMVSGEDIGMSGGQSLLRDFIPIRIGENLYGRLWVHADITERKKAEEALRESETRLRTIFETSVDAIGVSKAGIHVSANPAYLALFGYSDNESIIGKSITDLIAPSQRPVIAENVHLRARGDSAPSSYETRGIRKDGTEFDMDVRVSTYTAGGEVFSMVIIRDITERKRAEKALRESEERFKVLSETSPVGMGVVASSEATFLYVNPAYEKAFGYPRGELLGRKSPDIWWNPAERERVVATLKETGAITDYEVRLKRKDGSMFWGLASNKPITYNGRPATLGTFIDITDRKKAEEEISRHMEEVRVSNEELARFNRVAVDRELRMIELKKQVNELCGKAGMEPRYKVEGEESH